MIPEKEIKKIQEGDKTIVKTKGVPLEEARKVLLKEQSNKQTEVVREVNAILDKHGYSLQVEHKVIIVPNRRR